MKQYEILDTLSREQLIEIITNYDSKLRLIGEVCVSESKLHISSEGAVQEIREQLNRAPKYCLYDFNLSAYIDWQLGKISTEEYRNIILGEE